MKFTYDMTRLTVPAVVAFHGRAMLSVNFMFDTGSPETMVDECHTSQRRIFANNLKLAKEIILGGSRIELYSAGKTTLNFRDEEGKIVAFETDRLCVSRNLGSVAGGQQRYSGVNLLGLSFLLEQNATFFMDIANNVAYIEIQGAAKSAKL